MTPLADGHGLGVVDEDDDVIQRNTLDVFMVPRRTGWCPSGHPVGGSLVMDQQISGVSEALTLDRLAHTFSVDTVRDVRLVDKPSAYMGCICRRGIS
jgi:hypothetical protein